MRKSEFVFLFFLNPAVTTAVPSGVCEKIEGSASAFGEDPRDATKKAGVKATNQAASACLSYQGRPTSRSEGSVFDFLATGLSCNYTGYWWVCPNSGYVICCY